MKKILVVDNDDFLRMFIKEALAKKGFEAVEAADGDTAVKMIGTHPDIELLILDLKMPRMSGEEAFRRIHALRPALKCLISASDITSKDVEVLSAMGVKAFLEKPYLPEDLYRTIRGLADSTSGTDPCALKQFKAVELCEHERRQDKREPLEKAVNFFVNSLDFRGSRGWDLKAVTTDISNMGLGVRTDYPLEPGNVLQFTNLSGVHAQGVLKWIVKYEDSYRAGMEGLNNWREFLMGQ